MLKVAFFGLAAIPAFMTALAEPQTKVKPESLPVYAKADATSTIAGTLKKGDAVVVEFSFSGESDIEWCAIREPAGYVPCESLDRPPVPKSPVVAAQTIPDELAESPTGNAATPPGFWDWRHQVTAGEYRYLGYARILATNFDFSEQQKDQSLRIADRAGLKPCIEETDRYARKGQLPPDALRSPSSYRTTRCGWIFQTFIEQVFALVTPEQQTSHRTAYAEFKREIANHRRVLEESR